MTAHRSKVKRRRVELQATISKSFINTAGRIEL